MLASLIALAVAQANPAPPPLDLEQQALVRCSAALGLEVARAGHDPEGRFATRAREFFVRASVRLIDETGRTRHQVEELLWNATAELAGGWERYDETPDFTGLDIALPPCLAMLETSGL